MPLNNNEKGLQPGGEDAAKIPLHHPTLLNEMGWLSFINTNGTISVSNLKIFSKLFYDFISYLTNGNQFNTYEEWTSSVLLGIENDIQFSEFIERIPNLERDLKSDFDSKTRLIAFISNPVTSQLSAYNIALKTLGPIIKRVLQVNLPDNNGDKMPTTNPFGDSEEDFNIISTTVINPHAGAIRIETPTDMRPAEHLESSQYDLPGSFRQIEIELQIPQDTTSIISANDIDRYSFIDSLDNQGIITDFNQFHRDFNDCLNSFLALETASPNQMTIQLNHASTFQNYLEQVTEINDQQKQLLLRMIEGICELHTRNQNTNQVRQVYRTVRHQQSNVTLHNVPNIFITDVTSDLTSPQQIPTPLLTERRARDVIDTEAGDTEYQTVSQNQIIVKYKKLYEVAYPKLLRAAERLGINISTYPESLEFIDGHEPNNETIADELIVSSESSLFNNDVDFSNSDEPFDLDIDDISEQLSNLEDEVQTLNAQRDTFINIVDRYHLNQDSNYDERIQNLEHAIARITQTIQNLETQGSALVNMLRQNHVLIAQAQRNAELRIAQLERNARDQIDQMNDFRRDMANERHVQETNLQLLFQQRIEELNVQLQNQLQDQLQNNRTSTTHLFNQMRDLLAQPDVRWQQLAAAAKQRASDLSRILKPHHLLTGILANILWLLDGIGAAVGQAVGAAIVKDYLKPKQLIETWEIIGRLSGATFGVFVIMIIYRWLLTNTQLATNLTIQQQQTSYWTEVERIGNSEPVGELSESVTEETEDGDGYQQDDNDNDNDENAEFNPQEHARSESPNNPNTHGSSDNTSTSQVTSEDDDVDDDDAEQEEVSLEEQATGGSLDQIAIDLPLNIENNEVRTLTSENNSNREAQEGEPSPNQIPLGSSSTTQDSVTIVIPNPTDIEQAVNSPLVYVDLTPPRTPSNRIGESQHSLFSTGNRDEQQRLLNQSGQPNNDLNLLSKKRCIIS